MTATERFWTKITFEGDCWLFTGQVSDSGYGVFWYQGRNMPAHRFAWNVILKKPLARRKTLHHKKECRSKLCCNPDHLTPMTRAKHASLHGQERTHCKRNHPLSGKNVWLNRGRRNCRTCRREATRNWRLGERAATD